MSSWSNFLRETQGGLVGWGGRGISLINKGLDCYGSLCVLFCVRQDEHYAFVAFAVQIMCYYACVVFGAVLVQAAFLLLLLLWRSVQCCSLNSHGRFVRSSCQAMSVWVGQYCGDGVRRTIWYHYPWHPDACRCQQIFGVCQQ